MINQNLHRQPTALDREQHRQLKLPLPVTDWSVASQLNAIFLAATEFGDGGREFPLVFVRAGTDKDGKPQIAPVAVLGLAQGQNLFVTGDRWRGRYIPAVLNTYPFCIGRLSEEQFAVCVDLGWPALGTDAAKDGQPVFTEDGQPTPLLTGMQQQLERLEGDINRTRVLCNRLFELGLMQDMRFDVTLPDGRKHTVDGFLTIDDKKMQDLPDATVGDLHRSGALGLVHAHWISMGNMRRLVDWFVERTAMEAIPGAGSDSAAATPAAVTAPTAPAQPPAPAA